MAESTVPKTPRDGIIAHADNAGFGGANLYTVAYEPGNMQINAPLETRNDLLDRGRAVSSVRHGEDQLLTGSYGAYFRDAYSASEATLFDLVNWKAGGTSYIDSNWTGTLGSSAEVKTSDLRLTIEGSDHGDGADHTITITDVSLDWALTEQFPANLLGVNWRSHTDVRPARA